ncbi:MAG TPA: murein biosynthesis integral membrane protein MurJ, partial [Candidatus Dojkabacteria bacterium]
MKNLLFREQTRIITAAASLMVLSIATKFVGMLFTALFAKEFGATRESDIFNAANVIPETITTIVLIGAVSGSVIPVLIKVKINESKEIFNKFFSSLLTVGFLTFFVISILIIIFSHSIVSAGLDTGIIDPRTPFSSDDIERIGNMMRILMIPQALLGVSAFVSSALNTYERFIIPSLAPFFYNIGRIFGVVFFVTLMGGTIWGVVWGTVIGALIHLAVQIPLFLHLKLSFKPQIDFRMKYFRDVMRLATPRILSLAGEQISSMISGVIALSLYIGSITAFKYGLSLIAIPLSLFGATFAVAAFPSLSKFYEKQDHDNYSKLFRKVVNQIFFLTIPATAVILVLRIPLTRLLFGILGGEFDWEDTRQVAWVVFFLSLGLPFETLRSFMYRAFYSVHDSFRPLISSILVMIIGIVSAIALTNYFSHYSGFELSDIATDIKFVEYDPKDSFPFAENISISSDFLSKFKTRGEGTDAVGGLGLASAVVFGVEFFFLSILFYRKKILSNSNRIIKDVLKKFFAGFLVMSITYVMFKFWDNVLVTTKTLNLIL